MVKIKCQHCQNGIVGYSQQEHSSATNPIYCSNCGGVGWLDDLVYHYDADTRQSVKSEDVQEAIEQLSHGGWQSYQDGYPITLGDKTLDLAITALQEYRPCAKVSEGLPPENELRNGMVLAWSTELDEWQVENWGYVKDRPDDYTHWMTLPEPPKGE